MNEFARSLLTAWDRNGEYAAKLVADLTEDQMVVQPAPGTNHPAWIFSHLNVYHPVMVSMLSDQTFPDPRDHPFGMLSKPESDRSLYAPKAELAATYQSGHEDVTRLLQSDDVEARFAHPMQLVRWQAPFPTVGSVLGYLMLVHESTHLGQLSAWRRVQGLPSV